MKIVKTLVIWTAIFREYSCDLSLDNGNSNNKAEVIKRMEACDPQKAAIEAVEYVTELKSAQYRPESQAQDPASDRMFSPEMLLEGGPGPGQTYMGPALATIVDFFQLGKVTHEFENSLFGAATCTFCKAAFLFLQVSRRRNYRKKNYMIYLIETFLVF